MNPASIITKPAITEKSTNPGLPGRYTFLVAAHATKPQIKQAVETLFDVAVSRVNTGKRPGKSRRAGPTRRRSRRTTVRKAIVTLKQGHTIKDLEIKE